MSTLFQAFCIEQNSSGFHLSCVLVFALFFWLSCVFGLLFFSQASITHTAFFSVIILAAALACTVLGWLRLKENKRTRAAYVLLSFAVCAAGFLCAEAHWQQIQQNCSDFGVTTQSKKTCELDLFVLEDAQPSSYGYSLKCATLTPAGKLAKVCVYTSSDEYLYYGMLIHAKVTVSPPNSSQQDNFIKNGICAQANIQNIIDASWLSPFAQKRSEFIESTIKNAGESESIGLLLALSCGYRQLLNESNLYRNFQVSGLAHVVAVSGAHLSITIAFVCALLMRLKIKKQFQIALSLLFILVFLFVCAFPISAFRAAFMSFLATCSFFARRRGASQNALGLCVFTCLLVNPSTAVSVSFALSALSTLGIIVLVPLLKQATYRRAKKTFPAKVCSFLKENIFLTLSASIATLPLSAAIFSQVSLIAPVSNIVLGALFTPLCLCSITCQFIFLACGATPSLLLVLSRSLCDLFSFLVGLLASFPYAAVPAYCSLFVALCTSFVAFVAVVIISRNINVQRTSSQNFSQAFSTCAQFVRKHLMVFCVCVICSFGFVCMYCYTAFTQCNVYLAALDVGQGDALLIRDINSFVLIDTGNQDTRLKTELAKKGVSSIDTVFITHPDDDHCGSLATLLSVVEVKRGCVPEALLYCECSKCAEVKTVFQQAHVPLYGTRVGDTFTSSHAKLTVLWPKTYVDEGGNQDSLCMRLSVDINNDSAEDYSALLVGDAEEETLEQVIAQGFVGQCNIYKVGHHGSKVACSEEEIDALSPALALISVGKNNRYGHPNNKIISLLENNNVKIARTDTLGTITCLFENEGIRLLTSA